MDIDQELAAALTVNPSPEFGARLRTHIAHAAAPADRNLSMMLVATGSAMLAIVIAVALGQVDRNGSATGSIEKPAAAPPLTSASSFGTVSSAGPVKNVQAVRNVDRVRRKDPEVLVPAHEAAALRELFAAVRDRRVDLTAMVDDVSYTFVETDLRGETVIPPVSLELVQAITNSEGALQ